MKLCLACGRVFDDAARDCPSDGDELLPYEPSLPNGDVIEGGYRIQRALGVGQCGEVFECREVSTDQQVVLRLLAPELTDDRITTELLLRHQMELKEFSHRNVVKVRDVNLHEGRLALVRDWVDGERLHDLLVREEALTVAHSLELSIQIATALEEAHRKSLLHLQLRSTNVFLEVGKKGALEQAMLIDFGIGPQRVIDGRNIFGTIRTLSPEQIEGRDPTPRSDVYSLGLLIFRMITGTSAFAGTGNDVVRQALELPLPPTVPLSGGNLPHALETLVHQMTDKNPASRPRSMAVVLDRLRAIQRDIEDDLPFELAFHETMAPRRASIAPGGYREPQTVVRRMSVAPPPPGPDAAPAPLQKLSYIKSVRSPEAAPEPASAGPARPVGGVATRPGATVSGGLKPVVPGGHKAEPPPAVEGGGPEKPAVLTAEPGVRRRDAPTIVWPALSPVVSQLGTPKGGGKSGDPAAPVSGDDTAPTALGASSYEDLAPGVEPPALDRATPLVNPPIALVGRGIDAPHAPPRHPAKPEPAKAGRAGHPVVVKPESARTERAPAAAGIKRPAMSPAAPEPEADDPVTVDPLPIADSIPSGIPAAAARRAAAGAAAETARILGSDSKAPQRPVSIEPPAFQPFGLEPGAALPAALPLREEPPQKFRTPLIAGAIAFVVVGAAIVLWLALRGSSGAGASKADGTTAALDGAATIVAEAGPADAAAGPADDGGPAREAEGEAGVDDGAAGAADDDGGTQDGTGGDAAADEAADDAPEDEAVAEAQAAADAAEPVEPVPPTGAGANEPVDDSHRRASERWADQGFEEFGRRQFSQAKASFEHALLFDPRNRRAKIGLGRIAFQQGRFAEAVRYLEPMFRMRGNMELGIAYVRVGRTDEARQQFERILARDPDNADAQRALRSLP